MDPRAKMMVLAAGAALCLAPALVAQEEATKEAALTDEQFVTKAVRGGAAEVGLGKMALERGQDADVKKFAQQMVTDHTKANTELLKLAQTKQIETPTEQDPKHQKMVDELSELTGAEFDRAYMKGQVKDHEEAVKLFEAASRQLRDADLKGFAAKTLPIIQKHLQMARRMTGEEPATGEPAGDNPPPAKRRP